MPKKEKSSRLTQYEVHAWQSSLHAKGIVEVEVRTGLLALRVRTQELRSKATASLPRVGTPVTGRNVLAYSCAAARDLHPLPNPIRANGIVRTTEFERTE